jgi:hypothetical protein
LAFLVCRDAYIALSPAGARYSCASAGDFIGRSCAGRGKAIGGLPAPGAFHRGSAADVTRLAGPWGWSLGVAK